MKWFGLYFLFSCLVSGMPEPEPKDGKGYRWAYASLHAIAGNAKTVLDAFKNGNGVAKLVAAGDLPKEESK